MNTSCKVGMVVDGKHCCQKIANKRLMYKSVATTRMNQAYLIASKRFAFPRWMVSSMQGKPVGIHEATHTEVISIDQEKRRIRWRVRCVGKGKIHSSPLRWNRDNLYYFRAYSQTIRLMDVVKV